MKTINKQFPFISVIIPMRNEERYIKKCLLSFINQDYPKYHFEIIVIDGCSEDRSSEIVTELIKSHNNIKIIENKKKITPIALNIGVKHAIGDIIIIFSSHGFAERRFLTNNVKVHTTKNVDCVGGTISTIGETFQSKAISLAQSSIFGVGNSLFRYAKKAQYVDTVAFGAYSKDVFNKIGYFDETLVRNQDFEFNHRLIKNGGKIFLDPSIKSFYYARSSIGKLFIQYLKYGYWKVSVVSMHSDAFRFRYQVPALFVLSLIILSILGIFNKLFLTLLLSIISVYVFIIMMASIFLSIQNRYLDILVLPLTFCALHFGFGLGFMYGSIRYLFNKSKHIILGNK
jgi:glycosyltransferase involved in cell wall biosynthesis